MAEQYFTADPTCESKQVPCSFVYRGHGLNFMTDAGVFSKGELDTGTRLLLDALPDVYGDVLDLGCGWGAVGVISKKIKPALDLVMTDVNTRAAELARQNLARNAVCAQVVTGDGFEQVQDPFDWILLNPPIRAGKQLVYALYQDSARHLTENGTLAIVIRKQQGALSTKEFLQTLFEDVRLVNRKKGYHIYFCRRAQHDI